MEHKTTERILRRLKAFFDPHLTTSFEDWKVLTSYLIIKRTKAGAIIKHAGEKERFLRFILSGACAMVLSQEGKDINFDLCFEDEFLADFKSLYSGKATRICIRAFEPVEMVMIDKDQLLKIYNDSLLGTQLGKVLAERRVLRDQTNIIDYVGLTAEERYRKLLQNRPKVLLRTPVYYLASYMGVSRETLSRIRNRVARG